MPFEQALERAKAHSGSLRAAEASASSAEQAALGSRSGFYPRLGLEGVFFYQSNVPEKPFAPGAPAVTFGTHRNYSVGPVLSYDLFDGGRTRQAARSAELLADARKSDSSARSRDLEYALSVGYFRAQYALTNLALTANALELARAQSRDIAIRLRAGAASQLDQASSRRQYLTYVLRFRQAQTELSSLLSELLALTGEQGRYDLLRPAPSGLNVALPAEVQAPTLYVQFDSLEDSLSRLRRQTGRAREPDRSHPQLRSLEFSSRSSQASAEAQIGTLWPRLTIQGKSSYLYPNFILPENAWNHVLGVNLSMPLFEGGLASHQAAQKRTEALAYAFLEEQRESDLRRDFEKARVALASLQGQREAASQAIQESERLAGLTYAAYRSGKVNYTDVQAANLQLLESQVSLAGLDQQVLAQLATLRYLSSDPTEGNAQP